MKRVARSGSVVKALSETHTHHKCNMNWIANIKDLFWRIDPGLESDCSMLRWNSRTAHRIPLRPTAGCNRYGVVICCGPFLGPQHGRRISWWTAMFQTISGHQDELRGFRSAIKVQFLRCSKYNSESMFHMFVVHFGWKLSPDIFFFRPDPVVYPVGDMKWHHFLGLQEHLKSIGAAIEGPGFKLTNSVSWLINGIAFRNCSVDPILSHPEQWWMQRILSYEIDWVGFRRLSSMMQLMICQYLPIVPWTEAACLQLMWCCWTKEPPGSLT